MLVDWIKHGARLVSDLWSLLTTGNILSSLLFLLLLHYLVEFYQLRGMPAGPRLYSIPFFGNFLSLDSGAGKSLCESISRHCVFNTIWDCSMFSWLTKKVSRGLGSVMEADHLTSKTHDSLVLKPNFVAVIFFDSQSSFFGWTVRKQEILSWSDLM